MLMEVQKLYSFSLVNDASPIHSCARTPLVMSVTEYAGPLIAEWLRLSET